MLIKDFIWAGKRAKIPMNILQGNKLDGGLGLIDIEIKDRVLKMQWVVKLLESEDEVLKGTAYKLLHNPLGDEIWQIQLDKSEIVKGLAKEESFWSDVLQEWTTLDSEKAAEETFIWFNSEIKIAKESIYWKKWSQVGINTIKDLYDENNRFYMIEQLKEKYNIETKYLEYQSIKSAISNFWRKERKERKEPFREKHQTIIEAKSLYRKLKENDTLLQESVMKWKFAGIADLEIDEFRNAVRNIYKSTNYVKYRSFQY